MLVADQMPPMAVVVAVALFVGLFLVVLFLFRRYEHFARRSLERIYLDFEFHDQPTPADVVVSYHTYHGFLVWFTQSSHQVALPPEQARGFLGRLLRFNLTWGLFTCGSLIVVPLALINYFAQLRSISRQEANNAFAAAGVPASATSQSLEFESPPTRLHRVVGWIARRLCIMFITLACVSLYRCQIDLAVGGLIFAALLGSVARDWRKKWQ
jgi:hypothetical protein